MSSVTSPRNRSARSIAASRADQASGEPSNATAIRARLGSFRSAKFRGAIVTAPAPCINDSATLPNVRATDPRWDGPMTINVAFSSSAISCSVRAPEVDATTRVSIWIPASWSRTIENSSAFPHRAHPADPWAWAVGPAREGGDHERAHREHPGERPAEVYRVDTAVLRVVADDDLAIHEFSCSIVSSFKLRGPGPSSSGFRMYHNR